MAMSAGSVNDKNWKDLIRPNRPVVEHDRDAQRKAKLVIEPLEFNSTIPSEQMPDATQCGRRDANNVLISCPHQRAMGGTTGAALSSGNAVAAGGSPMRQKKPACARRALCRIGSPVEHGQRRSRRVSHAGHAATRRQ